MTDLVKLRELALAAKNGPARLLIDDIDKAFIAAASPDVVIALLDEIEHEREHSKMLSESNRSLFVEKSEVEAFCARVRGEYTTAKGRCDVLERQLAAMTAARDEACGIAEEWIGDATTIDSDRIAELRKIGAP